MLPKRLIRSSIFFTEFQESWVLIFLIRPMLLESSTQEKFLANLGYDRLLRIAAVMYSGRDNDSVIGLMEYLPKTLSGKDDLVRKISEKRHNLENYFSNGIAKSKAEGIDLSCL